MKTLCISHSRDLDGWCSAAIVSYWYRKHRPNDELRMLGWDYGDKIPEEEIRDVDWVIMCDISFSNDDMIWVMNVTGNNLIWIDHHISAINKVGNADNISGLRNSKYAACELVWQYFFPDHQAPDFVWWLGMYDSFRHKGTKWEADTLKFQYAARARWFCPMNFDYMFGMYEEGQTLSLRREMDEVLDEGDAIYKYLCEEAKADYNKIFDIELDGYKFAAINRERFNPINFGIDYHEDGYDGFACFWWDATKDKWVFSLYSDNGKTDVSKIAEKRGGGGHFGASGFRQDKLNVLNYKKS